MRVRCVGRVRGRRGCFVRFVGIGGVIGAGSVGRGIVGWSVVRCIRIRGARSFMLERGNGVWDWSGIKMVISHKIPDLANECDWSAEGVPRLSCLVEAGHYARGVHAARGECGSNSTDEQRELSSALFHRRKSRQYRMCSSATLAAGECLGVTPRLRAGILAS